jgi:hypothetical protein
VRTYTGGKIIPVESGPGRQESAEEISFSTNMQKLQDIVARAQCGFVSFQGILLLVDVAEKSENVMDIHVYPGVDNPVQRTQIRMELGAHVDLSKGDLV